MKKIIFILFCMAGHLVWAQAKCDPVNKLNRDLVNAKAAACGEINKKFCIKDNIDKDLMRKHINRLLDMSMGTKSIQDATENWERFLTYNPWAEKFYAPRGSYEIQKKIPPTPILDWFNDSDFALTGKTDSEYKAAFIEKFVNYGAKMDCFPTFQAISKSYVDHPTMQPLDLTKVDHVVKKYHLSMQAAELKQTENVGAVEAAMKNINDRSLDTFFICSKIPDLDADGLVPGSKMVERAYEPCAGNFKKNFANNKYDVSPKDITALLAAQDAQEVSACIKDRMAKGARIHSINITSSASSLNNTGEAANRFCAKGFLGLSTARAETARDKIVPELFKQAGYEDGAQVEVKINAAGSNGDGTSGDCAYEMKDGKQVLITKYATEQGKAELDENRYVKIQVTFDKTGESVSSIVAHKPMYPCKKIVFSCSDAPAPLKSAK